MPKRSVQDKLVRYKRKIRKLEEEQKKRRRIIRPLDSSDDENSSGTPNGEQYCSEPQPAVPQNQSDEFQTPLPPPVTEVGPPDACQDVAIAPIETTPAEPTIDLDPELLSALGASTSDTPDFGEPIHDSLSKLWSPLLKRGLAKEDKDNLMKEYLVPSNCSLLQAPKLNAEISAAVCEVVRARDKKLVGFQQELGAGTSAVNRAMDSMLKADNKIEALKYLSDGCRLLADLHFSFSSDRKKLVTPSLDKNFLHQIQDTERDDTLFGNSLADKIKASKAIERQGRQIRKFMANQKATVTTSQQSSVARPVHQGNWTGPPRYQYPPNRGGRGGQTQRKPAPAVRRPYSTTMAQVPSKNFNQPKGRAHAQQ